MDCLLCSFLQNAISNTNTILLCCLCLCVHVYVSFCVNACTGSVSDRRVAQLSFNTLDGNVGRWKNHCLKLRNRALYAQVNICTVANLRALRFFKNVRKVKMT